MDEDMAGAAREYAGRHGYSLGEPLGAGIHGCVWMLLNDHAAASALKIHRNAAAYRREREVYLRLREHTVREVRGLSVPEFIRSDDALLALEMTIVSPPRVLDFGADHLDWPPKFSDEIWVEWTRKNEDSSATTGRRCRRFSASSKTWASTCSIRRRAIFVFAESVSVWQEKTRCDIDG